METQRIEYADIHFHTEYSDNRDLASLKTMVQQGRDRGISFLSSGDHNHNLTVQKWESLSADRENLHDDLVACGCEGTFKRGHFLILDPGQVSGDFEESIRWLHGDGNHPIVLAHPIPGMDEWHEILYPSVVGIEVINGAVFAEGLRRGLSFESVVALPTMNAFFAYLDIGVAPAVTGSSDAHRISALGSGVTGYWGEFRQALQLARTFASTDTDIELKWELSGPTFSWRCADRADNEGSLTLYRGREAVSELSPCQGGGVHLDEPGFYWLGYVAGNRCAVGSPVDYSGARSVDATVRRHSILRSLEGHARRLAAFGTTHQTPWKGSDTPSAVASPSTTMRVYGVEPELIRSDDEGGSVVVTTDRRVVEPAKELVRLDGGSEYRDELLVYLTRNEIHEYRIVSLFIDAVEPNHLALSAWMAPSEHVREDEWRERWVSLAKQIAETVSDAASVTATLRLLPEWELDIAYGTGLPRTLVVRDGDLMSSVQPASPVIPPALEPWILEVDAADLFSSPYNVQVFTAAGIP